MYHSLADGRFPDGLYPKYTTTRVAFAEHICLLQHEGFHVAGFSDLLRRLQHGSAFPEKYVVLTIDDGHKSSLQIAELMQSAGARGTFFLTMNYCRDRADFLKPTDIRHLAAAGFDFGTHGASHRALSRIPETGMLAELRDSKHWLEDILGRSVKYMSLPAGQGSKTVRRAAFNSGYQLIGNSVERLNGDISLPGEINRFVVLYGYSDALVRNIAAGSYAYIWLRRIRAALLALPKRVLRSYDKTRQ